mmetsp:Transcript_145463/g.205990  ORF Transcript_145463/g.205990 Transcript_145463/m.205990 type:complete len:135 (-) Transcript_145463:107-511(-)|eukprot:symbB.v1.2.033020.t1/scaffold4044.1/size45693/3
MKLLLVILQLGLVFCANFLEMTPTVSSNSTKLVESEDDDNAELARMKDSSTSETDDEEAEATETDETEEFAMEEDEKDLETADTGGDESVEAEEKLMQEASASESDEMDADEEEIETGFDELEYIDKEDPESDI